MISVKRPNFILVFSRAACHAKPDTVGKTSRIKFIYFKTHQLTIMYCFKHAIHDILSNFLFQNIYKFFLRARNLHEQYFPYLSHCENHLLQVTMFHEIFSNYPYFIKVRHSFTAIKETFCCRG